MTAILNLFTCLEWDSELFMSLGTRAFGHHGGENSHSVDFADRDCKVMAALHCSIITARSTNRFSQGTSLHRYFESAMELHRRMGIELRTSSLDKQQQTSDQRRHHKHHTSLGRHTSCSSSREHLLPFLPRDERSLFISSPPLRQRLHLFEICINDIRRPRARAKDDFEASSRRDDEG